MPQVHCTAWFGLQLDQDALATFWALMRKDTIIYELELLAACVALRIVGSPFLASSYPVHYGDNGSVRFALIRGIVAQGIVAENIMQFHLEVEVSFNSNIWFARVPTEANIADLPSRALDHSFLDQTTPNVNK